MPLSRNDILKSNDIVIEPLDIPEWGGTVYIKTLTGAERNLIEKNMITLDRQGRPTGAKIELLTAYIAFAALCDEQGNRLFTDVRDIQKLADKSAAALDRVAAKAQAMAGMSQTDIDNLVGELKNNQPAVSPIV